MRKVKSELSLSVSHPLFLSQHFHPSLDEKSHGNKKGCDFAKQFVANAETKIRVVIIHASGGTSIA